MITREALDRLAELVAREGFIGDEAPDAVTLPESMHVVDLERYQPHRLRFRAQFVTRSISAFAEYLNKHSSLAPIFVDAEKAKARCVLDLGTIDAPGHCEHSATLELKATALWAAILDADGTAMSQRTLAEWIEDWRHALRAFDGPDGDEIPIAKAATAIRTINIKAAADVGHSVDHMRESRSAFHSVEASSPDGLPAIFLARVTPYEELGPRDVTLRVSVMTGDSPSLKLRIVALGTIEEAIGVDFMDAICESIATGQVAMLGKISTS